MASSTPPYMHAVRIRAPNDVYIDTHAPIPEILPSYILIRVISVALNPSDWKGAAFFQNGDEPRTLGLDVAGRVVRCGEDVSKYREGDRIAGLCYGNRPGAPTQGAFGEYAIVKAALSLKVPEDVSDAEAATVPVGLNFAGMALYHSLPLPFPTSIATDTFKSPSILIYGGATASGMFALQFARLSGCHVLTTCSPRNFPLVKALGAHEVFDYHDDACGATIRAATGDNLRYAFDCIAADSSLKICADALTSTPDVAVLTAALPVAGRFSREGVQYGWTSGYSAFGEEYHILGKAQPVKAKDFAFATQLWESAEELLKLDLLRLGPLVQRCEHGLAEIPKWLGRLKEGLESPGKVVFTVG